MISFQSKVHVAGVRARSILEFLLRCDDHEYQAWWPGTHLRLHTVSGSAGEIGSVVHMDERVGRRRLKMNAVLIELVPEKRAAWQMKLGVALPARLTIDLDEIEDGVLITHTVRVGFGGLGRILDPIFAIYLSRRFLRTLDQHVHIEFPRLGALLRERERHAADPS